jgi:hypothetical protein
MEYPQSNTAQPIIPPIPNTIRLYSPAQIGWAAALGGPMSGCIVLMRNFQALREKKAAIQTLLWGGIGSLLVIYLILWLKDLRWILIANALIAVGIYFVANALQGMRYQVHLAHGGTRHSPWTLVGDCLFGLVSTLVIGVLYVVARVIS